MEKKRIHKMYVMQLMMSGSLRAILNLDTTNKSLFPSHRRSLINKLDQLDDELVNACALETYDETRLNVIHDMMIDIAEEGDRKS